MIKLSGDFAGLDRFSASLSHLATDGRTKVAREIKSRADALQKGVFAGRRDPYGAKWKRRKRSYPWPILDKTGVLKGSIGVSFSAGSITWSIGADYGVYHQSGTARMAGRRMIRMAARMMIPSAARGLPPIWARDFEHATYMTLMGYF